VEICICAAVLLKDGRIIRGHRHSDALQLMWTWETAGQVVELQEQGFMTSTNRFVGRKEAMELQKAAGAKSCYSHDGVLRGDILFSEDLY
jgi:hypothetical protein